MLKKIVIGGLIAIAVLFAGAMIWAKSVLTGENVRATLAAQIERAIGQPVTIGEVSATIVPRVTVTLSAVTVGRPERITIGELHVATDFRALLSRRIEHANLKLTGARLELPLPPFTITSSAPSEPGSAAVRPPLELISIDEIVLSDVLVTSGGRTLRGDIELVPQGMEVVVRKIALGADRTTITATGRITDLTGPVGELTVKAGVLDIDQLLAFVNDFAAGAGMAEAGATPATTAGTPGAGPGRMHLALSLDAQSATLGTLTLSTLSGQAAISDDGLTLDPISFGVFGGRYQGSLRLVPGRDMLRFRGSSTLSNIDVAAATRFGGSPDTITGRLSGRLDFAASGTDPAMVMNSVTGRGRVDIVDGIVRNLGLVNSIVIATSMRSGSLDQTAATVSRPRDEPFSKLGATLEIARGTVNTNDLLFESDDLTLNARGMVRLVPSTLEMTGRVQLSDALSQQAGRDLVRYTQDQGRVTLPVTVSGSIDAPSVRIDAGDMIKRALQNTVNEQKERARTQATEAIKKKLGGLLGR